jgi:LacI family transcriptional regulator
MVLALEQEIHSNGYFMMLYISVNIEESVRMAHSWNAEGIIVVGGTADESQRLMQSTQVPLVFIDGYFHNDGLPYINAGLCDYEGSFMMTEYLISQGHRRIAFLANMERPFGVDEERLRGYKAALHTHDIPFTPADYIPISDRLHERHAQLTSLLHSDFHRYTALFFVSDYLAADSISFLYDNGVRVPEDLSVCGFDDNLFASTMRPALTTVHQDVSLKAVHAVRQALRLIRKEPLEEHDIRLPVSLRIRDSVHST